MDKFLSRLSLPITAVFILIAILIFAGECKRNNICPPKGYVLVTQGFIDTLIYVANMPPDTITDTLYIKGDIVYIKGDDVPVPTLIDPETNFYADSIVNDSISVWVDIIVKGVITKWDWRYQPTIIKETETITIYKPMPVKYEIPISKSGMYASLGVGGNESAFILSGELDLITRRDKLYGLQYMRFSEDNYLLFKLGTKISFRK